MLWNFRDSRIPAVGECAAVCRLSASPSAAHGFRALAARLALWRERGRSRRALAALDETRLRDIGLTTLDVRRETAKPFWRA